MVTVHIHPPSAFQFPEAWYDNNDRPGLDGHRHEYGFKTLRCHTCRVDAVPYQYTNIPGEPLPPRPKGRAIIAIYRADLVYRWMDFQNRHMARMIFANQMFDEYHDVVVEPDGPIDTEGVWLGGPVADGAIP